MRARGWVSAVQAKGAAAPLPEKSRGPRRTAEMLSTPHVTNQNCVTSQSHVTIQSNAINQIHCISHVTVTVT